MQYKNSSKKYRKLALGGTFDHFHKGHRFFLNKAFKLSKLVTIGITSDAFAHVIHNDQALQSFKVRKRELKNFLKEENFIQRSNIIELKDVYGTTVEDKSLEAILITANTRKGGQRINNKRLQEGNSELTLLKCQLLNAEDGEVISSHRIREGEIDREGRSYKLRLFSELLLKIPQNLRQDLRKPFGKIFKKESGDLQKVMKLVIDFIKRENLSPVICVGDVVTQELLQNNLQAHLYIVDLRVQRKKQFEDISELGNISDLEKHSVNNSAGSISKQLAELVESSLKHNSPSLIRVKGEEDLAVIPCVLLAPLGSVIIYGHFQYGVIAIEVNELTKQEFLRLFEKISKK
jgi:pantetheine-phosphate adenylyltransferase